MTIWQDGMNRRQYLAATGATVLVLGADGIRPALALDPIRQGYQTNIWGMPTYYLMKSGYLEKRGIKVAGVRGAVRQPHHAADGGTTGRHGHLRRPLVHHRP